MQFVHPEISIKSKKFNDDPCLYFEFTGRFTKVASLLSCEAWTRELENNDKADYVLIWDCSNMSGFELAARTEWQKSVDANKHKIAYVIVISSNIIIRSAAKVMLKLLGVSSVMLRKKEALEGLARESF